MSIAFAPFWTTWMPQMLVLHQKCHIFDVVHPKGGRRLHTYTFMSAISSRYAVLSRWYYFDIRANLYMLQLFPCLPYTPVQICIFCLPPSGVIPLHNHPGMTVFSKLLFGSLHVKSYDWVNLPQDSAEIVDPLHSVQPPGLRLAKVKTDGTFTAPCRTSVLFPQDGGNLHCFTARTSCAVLDVLGPPYSNPEEGRDCTYYNDSPYASFCGDAELLTDDGEYAWLEERKKPDEFIVVGANYSGPKIMDQ
ncbi:unnamed protein product [Musa acuminata subsp. malaccensis]|uniref:cysteine dioxygenase n=1 Tax=Musa acuminata subsp. malaccensis TaxID=214687 RepID=A0A804JVD1_MUSAM|nr:unnamed protein product [Musa acuminata subsp. malaccensis]